MYSKRPDATDRPDPAFLYKIIYDYLQTQNAPICSAQALSEWDQQVNMTKMPEETHRVRSSMASALDERQHEVMIFEDFVFRMEILNGAQNELDPVKRSLVRRVWRNVQREQKFTPKLRRDLKEASMLGQHLHGEAIKTNNFRAVAPALKHIVELKREVADRIGYEGSPLDALIDEYDAGLRVEFLDEIFSRLKKFIIKIVSQIGEKKHDYKSITGSANSARQFGFGLFLARKLGFDINAGRIDRGAFSRTFPIHPGDTRLVIADCPNDLIESIKSFCHETGHGLFYQGLPPEHFGTPLGSPASFTINEGISKLYENVIGQGLPFLTYLHRHMNGRHGFPNVMGKVTLDELYRSVNQVRPSLIRVSADELTYHLHIILRYEIEKELIQGTMSVDDLPEVWNDKMMECFGLKVSNLAEGCGQDPHWFAGAFGLFPNYTQGKLYAVDLYAQAKREMPNLEERFASGEFLSFRNWSREKVFRHGQQFTTEELIKNATGHGFHTAIDEYQNYIIRKYDPLYNLGYLPKKE